MSTYTLTIKDPVYDLLTIDFLMSQFAATQKMYRKRDDHPMFDMTRYGLHNTMPILPAIIKKYNGLIPLHDITYHLSGLRGTVVFDVNGNIETHNKAFMLWMTHALLESYDYNDVRELVILDPNAQPITVRNNTWFDGVITKPLGPFRMYSEL